MKIQHKRQSFALLITVCCYTYANTNANTNNVFVTDVFISVSINLQGVGKLISKNGMTVCGQDVMDFNSNERKN